MRKEFHAIVSGKVQMVMYRDFAQRHAKKHHITGTVRNLPDKTVEVVAQGEEEDLEAYIKKLHRGSWLAKVKDVAVEWRELSAPTKSFTIVY